jgi:uncharacterized membrane protein
MVEEGPLLRFTEQLDPGAAFELWTNLRRWPSFVDGFGHVERVDESWPAAGAKLVWRSRPAGRGIVTERVVESSPGERLVTQVLEERMTGTQSVRFKASEDSGTEVDIELRYELTSGGPLRGVTDFLFIRRAERDSLRRTLRRFAVEAAEEAGM